MRGISYIKYGRDSSVADTTERIVAVIDQVRKVVTLAITDEGTEPKYVVIAFHERWEHGLPQLLGWQFDTTQTAAQGAAWTFRKCIGMEIDESACTLLQVPFHRGSDNDLRLVHPVRVAVSEEVLEYIDEMKVGGSDIISR